MKKFYQINNIYFAFSLIILIFSLSFFSCNFLNDHEITYYEHIQPIIHDNCSKCHHNSGLAPFPLITYNDAKKRMKMIRFVIQNNIMPPWPANPNYTHFLDEMVLSQEDKNKIIKWVEQGGKKGDISLQNSSPKIPKYPAFGKPDMKVKFMKNFEVKGDGKDKYYIVKIPFEFAKDTFVKFIEFVPSKKSLIHHLNGRLLAYESNKKKNIYLGKSFVESYTLSPDEVVMQLDILNDDKTKPLYYHSVVNYLPGAVSTAYPNGIGGFKMPKKGVIYLNDLHIGPTSKDYIDSSYFNFYFTNNPPSRATQELQLGTLGISSINPDLIIPPNSVRKFITKGKVIQDISLLTINPHMHLLGQSFKAYALPPKGDTIPLIHIPRWDFRWQYFYTFPYMLHLPANSEIVVEAWFDNTSNNPNNPFNPPRVVSDRNGSMSTKDEMLQFIMTFIPYKKGDEKISLK